VTPDVFVVHTEPHYPAFPVTETDSDGVLRGLRNGPAHMTQDIYGPSRSI